MTYKFSGWRSAFKEYLELEERSDNTISSYLSELNAFVNWFEKTQGISFHPRLVTAINRREYKRLLTQKYKPGSTNPKLSTLSVFLAWAKETDSLRLCQETETGKRAASRHPLVIPH